MNTNEIEWTVNTHPDDIAVDKFAAAMKAKLAKKRAEGRGGWEDEERCSAEFLNQLLNEHVGKGDPVDVGNLAMMLWNRGERTSTEPVKPTYRILHGYQPNKSAANPSPPPKNPNAEPVKQEPVGYWCDGCNPNNCMGCGIPKQAQPVQQEPVAIVHVKKLKFHDVHINNHEWIEWKQPKHDGMELYAAPVELQCVDLPDEEAEAAFDRGGNELCLKLRSVISAFKRRLYDR